MSFSLLGLFGAGLLTFLSPCVLPLVPILLASLLVDTGTPSRFQRLRVAFWFVTGFTAVFVLMGLSIPGLTQSLAGSKPWLLLGAGVLLALFGLKMMRAFPDLKLLAWMDRSLHLPDFAAKVRGRVPRGVYGLIFGAMFGLSWTPCVGPILGGVLTYVASREASPLQGALLLLPFALGIAVPILILAWASDQALPWLNRLKKYLGKIEYAIGVGLFAFGVFVANQGRLQAVQAVAAAGAEGGAVFATDAKGTVLPLNSESSRPARLVFFFSEHCPICHAMERYLPDLDAQCSKENFELIRVNTDRGENFAAARTFNVKAVPTISILNDRGDEVVHLVGYQTQARLLEALRTTSTLACKAVLNRVPVPQEPKSNSTCDKDQGKC